MRNFKPLESGSQGLGNPVLFLDTSAPVEQLMDAAEWRIGAVQELLSFLSVCKADDGGQRDVANAARALLLLTNDAAALYDAARQAHRTRREG